MRSFSLRTALLTSTLAFAGCGTIMNGGSQAVLFDTQPGGGHLAIYDDALYHIKAIYDGPLPATVELPRKKILKYDVSRDGYVSRTVRMKPSMSGWEAASDIIPVLWSVDSITGGGRKFDSKIVIPMQPVAAGDNTQ